MPISDLNGFDKIKFGPGVIGRLTTLVGLAIVVLAALAGFINVVEVKVGIAGAIVLILVLYLFMAFRHADKHPSTSVLEGANAVRYHKQEMAAKGFEIDALPAEVRQMTTPPAQLLMGGARDE